MQNWLVAEGRNIALHRRLGWLGATIATIMAPLEIVGTVLAIARGNVTGMFPLGLFLAMNTLGMLGFGALTFTATRLRNRAGWYNRLMLCATALILGTAIGVPVGDAAPFAVIGGTILFIVAGIAFEMIVHAGFIRLTGRERARSRSGGADRANWLKRACGGVCRRTSRGLNDSTAQLPRRKTA